MDWCDIQARSLVSTHHHAFHPLPATFRVPLLHISSAACICHVRVAAQLRHRQVRPPLRATPRSPASLPPPKPPPPPRRNR
jgi:hypothetical protein